jgi:membrane associated rhomboid family serine protease
MNEPWFRRFAGFSYKPIRREGVLVLLAMAAVVIPCGVIFVVVRDRPLVEWSAAVIGVIAGIIGHAVIVWKLERDYS